LPLRYFEGVRQEKDRLLDALSGSGRPSPPLLATLDLASSLDRSSSLGLKAIKDKWEPSSVEEIYLYMSFSVIGAAHVPGAGRADTKDLTFLGIAYFPPGSCGGDACLDRNKAICEKPVCLTKADFERRMYARYTSGRIG
jgi:hypothetical protein